MAADRLEVEAVSAERMSAGDNPHPMRDQKEEDDLPLPDAPQPN
ncbi:MAG: hypothetical protein WA830_02710 [Candidatus Sulfotelmatobacter sp.]